MAGVAGSESVSAERFPKSLPMKPGEPELAACVLSGGLLGVTLRAAGGVAVPGRLDGWVWGRRPSAMLWPAGGAATGSLVVGGTGGVVGGVAGLLRPVIFPKNFWKAFCLGGAAALGRTRCDCIFPAFGRSRDRMEGISCPLSLNRRCSSPLTEPGS